MLKKWKNKQKNKTTRKSQKKRLAIKTTLCLIYFIVIIILFVSSYQLFEQKKEIIPWDKTKTTEEYTYMEISKMSERFAYFPETKTQIHFVIEKEKTGKWHTYLIAIKTKDYQKYKQIIDYSYERTNKIPTPIKVYGYPVMINQQLKSLAIKNIANFVPKENEIVITQENFESYLTNCYLDTTKTRKDKFSSILCITLFLLFIMVALFLFTIFDRDKIVDNLDNQLEKVEKKTKKIKKKR